METSNINELSLNFIDKLRLLWSVSKVSVLLRALAVQIGISSDCTKRNFRASNENVASKNGTNHLDIHLIRFESRRDLNSKVAINLGWSVIFNHNTLIGFTLTRLISIQPAQVTFDP